MTLGLIPAFTLLRIVRLQLLAHLSTSIRELVITRIVFENTCHIEDRFQGHLPIIIHKVIHGGHTI